MKKGFILLFLAIFQFSSGQDLNNYKYVVVPIDYDFLKEPNQFQLADLTKFLFEKEGFEAYLEGNLPEDINRNSCEVLYANLEEDSGLFVTRLLISLRDCNNKEVYRTEKGTSRIKNYERAYHEALRNAFASIVELNYNYAKGENVVEVSAVPQQEEETLEGEVTQTNPVPQNKKNLPEEKTKKTLSSSVENDFIFTRDNAVYYLEKTSSGYNFFQKEMSEPFAALVKSAAGDSFLYSSVTSKGVATFNQEGDLVVELLDSASGDLKTIIYKKQDQ